jgi:hypothetical protein
VHRIRYTTTAVAGLVLCLVSLLSAPAAFAVNLAPPGGGSTPLTTGTVASAGLTGWEVAVIALAAAVVSAALTAVTIKARARVGVRPAAG